MTHQGKRQRGRVNRSFSVLLGSHLRYCLFLTVLLLDPVAAHEESDNSSLEQLKSEITALRVELAKVSQIVTQLHRAQIPAAVEQPSVLQDMPMQIALQDFDLIMGDADASVVMLEYSEFQCPFCARFNEQTLAEVKRDYIDVGKVAFVPMDFPLDFHQQAKPASIFALCAAEQGKYWEARKELYRNQRSLGEETYQAIAAEIGVDPKRLQVCLGQRDMSEKVDMSIELGKSMGVRGTPTVFMGRIQDGKIVDVSRVVGAQPIGVIRKRLDTLLSYE